MATIKTLNKKDKPCWCANCQLERKYGTDKYLELSNKLKQRAAMKHNMSIKALKSLIKEKS